MVVTVAAQDLAPEIVEVESVAQAIAEARDVIAIEIEGLRLLQDAIGETFVAAVARMTAIRGRVIVCGIGKSGHIGRKIAATLASTGTPAMFLHAAEAGHGDLGAVGEDDLVLAISNSGESVEFHPLLQYCRRFGVPLVAITANAKSSLGRYADMVLELPQAREACPLSLAPMTSTTLSLVLGDALAAALMRAKGFARADFAKFHPAGKLGAQLLRLSEVLDMRPELRNVPRVERTAPLAAVIAAITDGRRGVTAVGRADEELVGVITDGDLRRALAQGDLGSKRAADIMTGSPLRIAADCLAADALAMCERHKVTALFVTAPAGGETVGLVHLQDLLSLGIA